ncbi:MAG: hypothetical protein M3R25_04000, partial [Bacteroidota bacterium]|nr:hypothetical protein [Bacteroidota bacterium]
MNKSLIEKYWEAETSLQEEEQLRKEQSTSQGPEAQYFAFLAAARKEKSMLSIDDVDAYNLKQTLHSSRHTVRPLYRWMASAAAVMIFVFSAFGVWKYSQQATQAQQMAETYDDPYAAYEEVRQALAFVSSKLNKSQGEALANIQKAGEYAEMFK